MCPISGFFWQKIENDTLRTYLKLDRGRTGVRVSRVLHGSSADGVLEIDDVILSVDGVPVACDGSVAFGAHERVQFEHLASQRQVGDRLALEVLRAGKLRRVTVTLAPYAALVAPPRPDRRPTYLIFAGLVFTPLTHEYMANWDWADEHHRYANYKFEVFPSRRRREVVLIHQVLAHRINLGYHLMQAMVVERINGHAIADMRDVVRALAKPQGAFHVIETDYHGSRSESQRSGYHTSYGTRIVLPAAETAAATADVLAQHGIAKDRSADLEEPAAKAAARRGSGTSKPARAPRRRARARRRTSR